MIERASVDGQGLPRRRGERRSRPSAFAAARRRAPARSSRKELIRPDRDRVRGETAFRFRPPPDPRRRLRRDPQAGRAPTLHERFALARAASTASAPAEYEEILGYHLEQAHRSRASSARSTSTAEALGRRAADASPRPAGARSHVATSCCDESARARPCSCAAHRPVWPRGCPRPDGCAHPRRELRACRPGDDRGDRKPQEIHAMASSPRSCAPTSVRSPNPKVASSAFETSPSTRCPSWRRRVTTTACAGMGGNRLDASRRDGLRSRDRRLRTRVHARAARR